MQYGAAFRITYLVKNIFFVFIIKTNEIFRCICRVTKIRFPVFFYMLVTGIFAMPVCIPKRFTIVCKRFI